MDDNTMIQMNVEKLKHLADSRKQVNNISKFMNGSVLRIRYNGLTYWDGVSDGIQDFLKLILIEHKNSPNSNDQKKQILEKLATLRDRGLYTKQDLIMMDEVMKEIEEL